MLDPELFALMAAVLEVLIQEKPELKEKILERQKIYREEVFIDHEDAYTAMREAFERITKDN